MNHATITRIALHRRCTSHPARRSPRPRYRWRRFPWLVPVLVGFLWTAGYVAAEDDAAETAPPSAATELTGPWSIDRGDAAATGAVARQLPESLVELWRYEAEEEIVASPIIVSRRVIVGDVEGGLHAVSLDSGKRLWKQQIDTFFEAPPVATERVTVIGDLDGFVRAFHTETGEPLWKFETGGEILAGAAIVDQTVLATSSDGSLYALDLSTGEQRWSYATGDQIQCRPTIAEERVLLGGCDGALHGVNLATGKQAAKPLPLDGPTRSTPAVLGSKVFVPTHGGAVIAFDWRAGESLWTQTDPQRPREFRNSAAATPQYVVVATKNQVLALDPSDGTPRWTTTLRGRIDEQASPVIAGSDVWINDLRGRLYRLSLKDGGIRWEYEVRGSLPTSPAIGEDRLVIANDKGVVICLGPPQ
jgi:outer membrane protein assembly factor BamB